MTAGEYEEMMTNRQNTFERDVHHARSQPAAISVPVAISEEPAMGSIAENGGGAAEEMEPDDGGGGGGGKAKKKKKKGGGDDDSNREPKKGKGKKGIFSKK